MCYVCPAATCRCRKCDLRARPSPSCADNNDLLAVAKYFKSRSNFGRSFRVKYLIIINNLIIAIHEFPYNSRAKEAPIRFVYPYWQNSDLWQMDTAYAAIAERQDLEGGRSSEVHHPRCQESFTLMSASFNKNLRCRRGTARRVVSVKTVRSVAEMFV